MAKKAKSGSALDRSIKSVRAQIAKIKKAKREKIAARKKATKLASLKNRLKSMRKG
jgi:Tfp pilus assembly protein PilN